MEAAVKAYAKLNLTLDVLGLRPDGYHELDMLMQTVSLYDEAELTLGTGRDWSLVCVDPDGLPLDLPTDGRNLAWRAAEAFFRRTGLSDGGLAMRIVKRIPAEAGLAGGSADCAAVLRALNEHFDRPLDSPALLALGAECGSDVPFCLTGGTARVRGRGEDVTPLTTGTVQHYVICKPPFGVSTPQLFALSDQYPPAHRPDAGALIGCLKQGDAAGAGSLLCNVLEPVAALVHPSILEIKAELLARAFAKRWGGRVETGWLKRVRSSVSQTRLGAAARRANVASGFAYGAGRPFPEALEPILVDDVLTTGATLESCARALETGGARVSRAMTLLRAELAGDDFEAERDAAEAGESA